MRFLRFIVFCIPSLVSAYSFHRDEEFIKDIHVYACRTVAHSCDDIDLVNRIIAAYQLAEKKHLGDSMWQMFYDKKLHGIHTVFQSDNFTQAASILRNPGQTELFYGIDNLCCSLLPPQLTHNGLVESATQNLDCLVRFGEAIGAIELDNVESYYTNVLREWYADEVLNNIETKLGISIHFPNPYADEVGICTYRGVASYRAIQAIYQAYRIKELLKHIPNPRVLEIGAGLGRTAYYCKQFGIEDYTIIDIPMTALASSYFLGRALGKDQVLLLGESSDSSENKIKILTPDQFLSDASHYDLIVNIDSLTEMDVNTIKAFLNKYRK